MKNRFIGRWTLLSCIGKTDSGEEVPFFGQKPFGCLIYTSSYMSVLISDAKREPFSTKDMRDIDPQEIKKDFATFECYCGRYGFDQNVITHFIESAKVPALIGTEFKRFYEFYEDKLILSSVDPLILNKRLLQFVLTWQKVE